MDEILGKWIFISQHGVEECLIKQNIGWIKRKLILSLAPNIIYSQPDENILRVEFQTKVKNMVRDYKWPGVTQHKGNIAKFEKQPIEQISFGSDHLFSLKMKGLKN